MTTYRFRQMADRVVLIRDTENDSKPTVGEMDLDEATALYVQLGSAIREATAVVSAMVEQSQALLGRVPAAPALTAC